MVVFDSERPADRTDAELAKLRELQVEAEKLRAAAGPKCLIEGCAKEAKWKGLCPTCYGAAKKIMDAEKLEWDDLEAMGLCVCGDSPFRSAFRRAKAARSQEKVTYRCSRSPNCKHWWEEVPPSAVVGTMVQLPVCPMCHEGRGVLVPKMGGEEAP